MTSIKTAGFAGDTLEIIAFRLHEQEFCVKTTTIREIRGWAPSTPIPHSPPDVIGVMNLRGTVIPIIDLAHDHIDAGDEMVLVGRVSGTFVVRSLS